MTDTRRGPLDLLALTPLQRRVIVHLTREGPADAGTLAQGLGQDLAEIHQTLAELARMGSIHLLGDGQAEINLGRTRRRTLPARLWPALLATSRLYSAQEIAALRTAVPILQLARARLGEFADHGPGHVLRVKSFATQLGYILGLTSTEQHLLWRDEGAIPIRLLYPTDLGPPPEGNESVIRVRLPAAQAKALVRALTDACNQTEI